MDESNYRTKMVDLFWAEKAKDPGLSIRVFSCLHNIRYYTFRDWYRDPMYNRYWASRNELNRQELQVNISLVKIGSISR